MGQPGKARKEVMKNQLKMRPETGGWEVVNTMAGMNRKKCIMPMPNKKYTAAMAAIILIWVLFAPVRSNAAEGKEVLTLSRALALAAGRNRDIQMALEYQNRVHGIYLEERAAALPQLTAQTSAGLSRDETQRAMAESLPVNRESWGAGIGLRQVIFTWGQVGAAIRAAKIGIQGAKDLILRYRQAVARDVTVAFEDALLAKELVNISRETLTQRERHAEESKRKFEAGTATDYDVLAAEVAVQNARPEVISAENRVTISLDHLAVLLGLEGRKLAIGGTLETEPRPLPDYEKLVALALVKRPELAESAAWIGIQRELITVAKAGNKPRLDFQGSTGWGSLEMGSNREEGVIATGEIVMTFPFFDGFRTDGRVLQAASELRRLEITDAKLRDEIRVQVSEALSALFESGEILTAGRDTVRQAKRLLEMAEKGFIYGVKTNLEVQDAELNLRQARGNLAKALRDHLAAAVTLDWVTGVIELPSLEEP
jgi:outer membrane protein TolC